MRWSASPTAEHSACFGCSRELGLPYAHRPERQQSMAVRALHPAGKIPVMLDGDNTLTDSTAIAQ